MPTYRVMFKDGSSMRVRVSDKAETSRESLEMVAKRKAVARKYHPGTLPAKLEASRNVSGVERTK